MPFGLQGAPGAFQEMMEILIAKVKNKPGNEEIIKKSFIGAFCDDCGIGTDSEAEHLKILEAFLEV